MGSRYVSACKSIRTQDQMPRIHIKLGAGMNMPVTEMLGWDWRPEDHWCTVLSSLAQGSV